jgi:hypothetical protein
MSKRDYTAKKMRAERLMGMKKKCAYCGGADAKTVDHVIPRSLYPKSIGSSVQRLTVPCCESCNNSWSDDEAHFRTMMTLSGEANTVATELWTSKVVRGFREADGKRRFLDVWANMEAVLTPRGERHKIYPASDPRFIRVLRKIVRGLHYHHDLGDPVPDHMAGADLLRWGVPEDITEAMPRYHLGRDVFEYQFETFEQFRDIPMRSGWLLTFFGNKRFAGWVWKE